MAQIILVLKLAEVSRHYLSWSQGNNEGHWRVAVPLSRGSSQPRVKARSPTLQVDSSPAEPQGKSKNTGVGSLSLLQSIFQTQESNQGLLHCRQIVYQLSYQGSPVKAQEGWYQSHQMHRTGEHQTQCHVFPNPHLSFFLTSQLDPVSTMSGSEMVQGD